MRRFARHVVDVGLRRSPLQGHYSRRSAKMVAVLAYHGVDNPARFAQHMDVITRWMQPIELSDLIASHAGTRPLPPRSVLVTFDDGERSVLDHAAPVLAERRIPAVVFVVAQLVDTDGPYWWTEVEHLIANGGWTASLAAALLKRSHSRHDPGSAVRLLKRMPNNARLQALEHLRDTASTSRMSQLQLTSRELRRLESLGMEIGNHTASHPCLDTCEDGTVTAEVIGAHNRLTEILGHPPRAFAYPNGSWDARAEVLLQSLSYEAAFRFDHRHVGLNAHPLRLSRLRVNSAASVDRLMTILSGLHPALHRARGGR